MKCNRAAGLVASGPAAAGYPAGAVAPHRLLGQDAEPGDRHGTAGAPPCPRTSGRTVSRNGCPPPGQGAAIPLPRPPHGQKVLDRASPQPAGLSGGRRVPGSAQPGSGGARLRILQDYVDVVVFRDVVERHGIANLPLARYLTRTLLRSVGRPVSLNKLHNDLRSQGRGVGKNTLYESTCPISRMPTSASRGTVAWFVPAQGPRRALKKIYAVDPRPRHGVPDGGRGPRPAVREPGVPGPAPPGLRGDLLPHPVPQGSGFPRLPSGWPPRTGPGLLGCRGSRYPAPGTGGALAEAKVELGLEGGAS